MASLSDAEIPRKAVSGMLDLLKRVPRAAIFLLGIAIYLWIRFIMTGSHVGALLATGFVATGSILGYFWGGSLEGKIDNSIDRRVKKNGGDRFLSNVDNGLDGRDDQFLTFTGIITGFYLAMYFEAVKSFQPSASAAFGLPVDPVITGITSLTIFVMSLFSVRYAGYIKMTKRLEAVLRESPDDEALVEPLRDAVFRDAQLYEPPGNVFVTVGITATFLGLAVALIVLDLPGLLESKARATASLSSFVACMGLALGMSMLGVMTALAAQWLRGHGAGENTDDLIARATLSLAPAPTAGGVIAEVRHG